MHRAYAPSTAAQHCHGRTDGRTNEEPRSPSRDHSPLVTRTRAYGFSPELDQIIRTLAIAILGQPDEKPRKARRDPHYKAHRRELKEALAVHDKRHVIEDTEWMLATGEHPDRIASRLGYTRDSLTRTLQRAQRPDLALRIDRRTAA